MKGEEGFALLERLAEKIGGEVACTRPCVDAGWMLPTQQVGQSGISVKPKLYLAFGIAGAIQHMTGIDADCIRGLRSLHTVIMVWFRMQRNYWRVC